MPMDPRLLAMALQQNKRLGQPAGGAGPSAGVPALPGMPGLAAVGAAPPPPGGGMLPPPPVSTLPQAAPPPVGPAGQPVLPPGAGSAAGAAPSGTPAPALGGLPPGGLPPGGMPPGPPMLPGPPGGGLMSLQGNAPVRRPGAPVWGPPTGMRIGRQAY